MKSVILLLVLSFASPSPWLLPSEKTHKPIAADQEVTITSPVINITTKKVSHIDGVVDFDTLETYTDETLKTAGLDGPRVIVINSPGGYVTVGEVLIQMMEAEKAMGIPQICVVTEYAHSMAFNFLTHCDVRLVASSKVTMVVHKIRVQVQEVMTAKKLRDLADRMEAEDEPYRQANSAAMHLSLGDYDKFADAETAWTVDSLLKQGYLNGIASFSTH